MPLKFKNTYYKFLFFFLNNANNYKGNNNETYKHTKLKITSVCVCVFFLKFKL